ncbi:T9SS type A sorting domain-containing protein [Dyadobacter pollutisoli]|uniref:T9SS type A sorting domain-containing protein n=1 Tax=Dyadobacter pollutisoli TaxID=2910158 RepID=A0A9E8N9D4_9BACT|nr:T9SS type A sorting domain-containing protein [Dyadobacter pollutisoli]WAC10284.1 T9SS type A sorting domain-containing protein [Dyadobacter pollutisoli]
MQKIYLSALLLITTLGALRAQTPTISIYYPENACLGAIQRIQVSMAGSFKDDNKFTVQVRKTDASPVAAELPATLRDGKLEVVHRDSSLSLYQNIQMRVVSSSPKVESQWVYFRLNSKGTTQLSLAAADTINAGDDLQIKFTTFSSSGVQITLNDSTRFSVSSYAEGAFVTYHQLGTDHTQPFYIAHAENVCGAMQVSGQVKAVINSTSLRTVGISPVAACEDSEVKISFSTMGPALTAQTKFRIKFIELVYSMDQTPRTAEVTAELRDNVLVASIPKTLKVKGRTQFKLQIIAENPKLMGAHGDILLVVYPQASVEFFTPSLTINTGDNVQIGLNFTGMPPFSASLTDGSVVSASYNGQAYISVRPGKTTLYTVESLKSGCGTTSVSGSQTMVVTVKEGVYLDSEGNYEIICSGGTAKMKVISNFANSAATTFTVHGVLSNQQVYSFPAKKVGDYLEFNIPSLPDGISRALSYDNMRVFYVTTQSPASRSNYSYKYVVQSKPDMVVTENSILNYDVPKRIQFGYYLYGRGPYTITETSGKINRVDYEAWYPDYFLSKTTDFQIQSISNSCFKKEGIGTVRLTVDGSSETTPGVYLDPVKTPVCVQDSIEIVFSKSGKFNAGNVFNIQGYGDCCNFQTLATVSDGGKYKVKIPANQYSNYTQFRVASTNPVLFSEQYQLEMQRDPSNFYISPVGTAENPAQMLKEENVFLTLSSQGGALSSFVYSDGVSDKTAKFENYNYGEKITPPVGVTTAYTIKSATNQCGTVPVNLTTYIKILPYRIVISEADNYVFEFCANGPMTIPFGVVQGDAGNATFSLEIAKDGNYDFTTLVKDVSSRQFDTKVPGDLSPGIYQLRITSSDGGISNILRIRIGAVPTVNMLSDRGEPLMVNAGEYIAFKLNFTGSAPWTAVFENNTKIYTTSNPDYRNIYVPKGGEYSVKSVYNTCGYGTATGKITVKVRAQLSTGSDSYTVCEGGSFTVRYNLLGDADLSGDYIRFELLDMASLNVTVLDSVKTLSGVKVLKIPSSLSGSAYQIRSTVRSLNLVSVLGVGVTTKADVTLTGNTLINSGESTNLIVRSNKNYGESITYKLSDGTTGSFYGGQGQPGTFIKVTPDKTTTYTLSSVTNSCGTGKVSGSALVEVNAPSERAVTVTNIYSGNYSLCIGDTALVTFSSKGNFSAGNVMTVQISDTTGKNFRSVPTVGKTSPLKAALPADLFSMKAYRVRVVASDANTASGAYQNPLYVSQKAKAKFASESVIYDGIVNPKIVVLLEGGGPWQYQYGTDLSIQYRYSALSSDTITLLQASPNQYYKLFSVSNSCGVGTIESPGTVRVEVITANEPAFTRSIVIAPNPTQDFLQVKFESGSSRNIVLYNLSGTNLHQRVSRGTVENIDLRHLSSGIYILHIESKGQRASYKIIKQ